MGNKAVKLKKYNQEFAKLLKEVYPGAEKTPVFGEGNPNAALVLVGEAPGRYEVEQGRPFVGKAGQNLESFLLLAGLERGALYVTNTVKFRPVKIHPRTGSLSNRPPDREEIALCQSLLYRELALIQPRIVATLGNTALKALHPEKIAIGEVHGTLVHTVTPGWEGELFALYHPASIIYNRALLPVYEEDVRRLGALLSTL